jgi:hypothetical protein
MSALSVAVRPVHLPSDRRRLGSSPALCVDPVSTPLIQPPERMSRRIVVPLPPPLHDSGRDDSRQSDAPREPAAEPVLTRHAVGEGGDCEIRCHGAEPESRDEQCVLPILLGDEQSGSTAELGRSAANELLLNDLSVNGRKLLAIHSRKQQADQTLGRRVRVDAQR